MKRLFLILIAAVTAAVTIASPKHEMRGAWVATVWGIDWPAVQGVTASVKARQQKQLSEILDRCERMNMTTVVFQVRSMADAMYESRFEPWSSFISGTRGVSPGWDPLEWVVDECHARGLECYVWVNPFRTGAGKKFDTPTDRTWKRKGWLLTHGNYTVLNPGKEEVRRHIVDVCRDIVTRYNVDGLIFDDYFYPNRIPADATAGDYDDYRRSGKLMNMADWRRASVHKLVADVSAMINDERPDVRFGIAPAGVAGKHDTSARRWSVNPVEVKAADWQWTDIYSDPVAWLYQGTVDFVSPQLYWPTTHATAPYRPLADWWDEVAAVFDRHAFPSITLADLDKKATSEAIADHERQVSHAAGLECPGVMLYSAKFLDRMESTLTRGPWARKAISPAVTWKVIHHYDAVKGLEQKGSRLQWDAVAPDADGAIVRYAVYAFPSKVSVTDALDPSGDGIDSRYLLGVTYNPSFNLPDDKTRKHRYAVSVLDGNSVEHPYSII